MVGVKISLARETGGLLLSLENNNPDYMIFLYLFLDFGCSLTGLL